MATQRCLVAPNALAGHKQHLVGKMCMHKASTGRTSKPRVLTAAAVPDAGWGDARPDWADTCLDQAGPGPLRDLDAEWQAFIANTRQPQPLIWSADSFRPSTGSSGSSSSTDPSSSSSSALASTSNRGPAASSSSSSSSRYTSSIQSFDDWDFADDDGMAVPMPCNLPVNEAAHSSTAAGIPGVSPAVPATAAGEAQQQQQQQLWPTLLPHAATSRELCSPSDLLGRGSLWHSLCEVYVLLFGVGQKDTEGIYSLRAVSEDGLPTETIIAFENMEDAVRYSGLLEATMEHSPYVCSIPPSELMAFCADSGYRCRLELEGSLLMPPDYNVTCTDWERSLRLREGKFYVLPEEPDYIHAASSSSNNSNADASSPGLPAAAGNAFQAGSGSSGQLLLRHSSEQQFTAAQLSTLKAQLEALLPASSSCDDDGNDDDDFLQFGVC